MKKESAVFITAHPDDVAFSAGGTAWLLREHFDIHVICASKGYRGLVTSFKRKGLPPPTPETIDTRVREEEAACELLGASLEWLGQEDGAIHPDRDVCEKVAARLAEIKPAIVLTHGPFEKKDHSAVFSIAYQSLFMAQRFWETELCMFFHQAGTFNLNSPCILVDINDVIDKKREQIRCHDSHIVSEEDVEHILERNRNLGAMTFSDYAEGFISPFPMVNKRWGRKPEVGRILLDLG